MLTEQHIIERFAEKVSPAQWQQQVDDQRRREILNAIVFKNALLNFGALFSVIGCFAGIVAAGGHMLWMVVSIIGCLVSAGVFLQGVAEICESSPPLLTRWWHRQAQRKLPPTSLKAVAVTRLEGHMLMTEIDYNGNRCLVERIAVDPYSEAATALASRIKVRNAQVNQHLQDIDRLLSASAASEPNQQSIAIEEQEQIRYQQRQLLEQVLDADVPTLT